MGFFDDLLKEFPSLLGPKPAGQSNVIIPRPSDVFEKRVVAGLANAPVDEHGAQVFTPSGSPFTFIKLNVQATGIDTGVHFNIGGHGIVFLRQGSNVGARFTVKTVGDIAVAFGPGDVVRHKFDSFTLIRTSEDPNINYFSELSEPAGSYVYLVVENTATSQYRAIATDLPVFPSCMVMGAGDNLSSARSCNTGIATTDAIWETLGFRKFRIFAIISAATFTSYKLHLYLRNRNKVTGADGDWFFHSTKTFTQPHASTATIRHLIWEVEIPNHDGQIGLFATDVAGAGTEELTARVEAYE